MTGLLLLLAAFAAILALMVALDRAWTAQHNLWPAVAETIADAAEFYAHADQAIDVTRPRIPTQRGAEVWPDGGAVDWDLPDGVGGGL
jgi:hypothetical protein